MKKKMSSDKSGIIARVFFLGWRKCRPKDLFCDNTQINVNTSYFF